MRPTFEPGDTLQFTMVTSVAPDAAPTLKIYSPSSENTVTNSITAQTSDSTHYYALVTMPQEEGPYVAEWFAKKTFQGSAYDFLRRFTYNVTKTKVRG